MSLILYNTVYTTQEYVVPSWGGATDEELAVALQKHYAGEVDLNEHWNIDDERTVELTTGESIQMVLMHKGQYPIVGEKVDTPVGNLSVGSVIQLNENGSPVDYMVVHQGNPDPEMYDASCDGTWVLRKDILEKRAWSSSDNDYDSSDIHPYLNGTFLNLLDNDTKNAIKQVKIPFWKSNYVPEKSRGVPSGENGLSCKIFLLSGYEVGFTLSDNSNLPVDGAKLSYFDSGTSDSANNKRIANYNGGATDWWLRSSYTNDSDTVFYVNSGGVLDLWVYDDAYGVRPALILDSTFTVKIEPTCAFVVGMKDCLNATHQMNSSYTNAGGWNGCEMRTWLNDTVYNRIPGSFRQLFKKMNVWTANGGSQSSTIGVYSEDYLALPAEKEVFGNNTYADESIEPRLFQFDWYKTSSNRIKQVSGRNTYWWERSTYSGSSYSFCCVTYSGTASNDEPMSSRGVSFFCAI